MKKRKLVFLFIGFCITNLLLAQDAPNPAILEYIETYAPLAIKEMNRTGVPASIKIAQGILETDAGRSDLVAKSNNHFGIKCKSSWTGEKVYHDDDAAGECFRKYNSATDSYQDHSDYLKSQPRYAFLFGYDADDYKSWAWGLKKAGYATNPIYAQTLIKYIETYNLNDLNHLAKSDDTNATKTYLTSLKNNSANNSVSNSSTNGPAENTTYKTESRSDNSSSKKKSVSYPEGVFRQDGCKVIYAKEGTSLLSLAKKYNVRLSGIISWNDLPKNTVILDNDQLLFLQHKKKHMNSKKRVAIHVVRKGESLSAIAKKYNVTVDSIKETNDLSRDHLQVGQSLKISK